jgi:hypothetical protein
MREMDLKVELHMATYERKNIIRQINRLYRMRVKAGLAPPPPDPKP